MISPSRNTVAALALGCAVYFSAPAAHALSAKECHQNFSAARKAGDVTTQSYKEFKATHCDISAPEKASAPPATAVEKTSKSAPAPAVAEKEKHTSLTSLPGSSDVVFPSAIAPQYAKLSAGAARRKTCVDQYNANKANGHNGSLKWNQKGGGYYSQCNSRLKSE